MLHFTIIAIRHFQWTFINRSGRWIPAHANKLLRILVKVYGAVLSDRFRVHTGGVTLVRCVLNILTGLIFFCFALFCSVLHFCLSCLVLSCLVLSCLVLSCLVLSCLVLSCPLVLSCLVLSCLVSSRVVLSCPLLPCLAFFSLLLPCRRGNQFRKLHSNVPSNFPVPTQMVCKGDLVNNWEFFRQVFFFSMGRLRNCCWPWKERRRQNTPSNTPLSDGKRVFVDFPQSQSNRRRQEE